MTTPHPSVSVVIPNWNGRKFLTECLDSLKGQTFRDFEAIPVDNGSTDGSAELAEERYGGFLQIIRNTKNLGYTDGNNIGTRSAKEKYIVLLNNDTLVEPTWLEELVNKVNRMPGLDVVLKSPFLFSEKSD